MDSILAWLHQLHSPEGISHIVSSGGLFVLIGIIFSETGLLVGFFLPGDSLLITAGVLTNPHNPHHIMGLNIWLLNFVLAAAAIVGNQVGYYLGFRVGDRMWEKPDGRLYKRDHLIAAHTFYERYGGFSVLVTRFMPIFRTFVPFVAGMARMSLRRFTFWNIVGGVLWTTGVLWAGYYLGQTPLANRLDKVILVVIVVSILPAIGAGVLRKRRLPKDTRAPAPNS